MPGRNREFYQTERNGIWFYNNNPTGINGNTDVFLRRGGCSDVTGDGDCFGFIVDKTEVLGGHLTATGGSYYEATFKGYKMDGLQSPAIAEHLTVPGVPSDVSASVTGAARTNPSRPYVDMPVNVLDIRTKPQQIMHDMQDMRRRGFWRLPSDYRRLRGGAISEHYLEYQFMVAPIVSDIVKLSQLSRIVDDRVRELNRLARPGGLRRTVSVFEGSATAKVPKVLQSAGLFSQPTFDVTTTVSRRVHLRWLPTGDWNRTASPHQIRMWATRAVLGHTIDLSTLWELTPWSWLADWCGNLGEYLQAQRNIIPAILMGVFPMRRMETTMTVPAFGPTMYSGKLTSHDAIRVTRKSLIRSSSFLAPEAHIPFLDAGRMGILAALVGSRRS